MGSVESGVVGPRRIGLRSTYRQVKATAILTAVTERSRADLDERTWVPFGPNRGDPARAMAP